MDFVSVLVGLALAAFAWCAINPVERWRMRHFPGPFGLPFLGNLPQIASEDLTAFLLRVSLQYGRVSKVWFGNTAWVVLSDPELVRKVAFKLLSRPSSPLHTVHMLSGKQAEVDGNTLVFIRNGPRWRLARKAFEASIIHPGSLAAHMPAVQRCLDAFLPRLGSAAASGQPLELSRALGELALAAVGEVAYGVDFGIAAGAAGVAEGEGGREGGAGRELISAIRDCFDCLDVGQGATAYLPLKWMLPSLTPLWYWLAARLPDAPQRRHTAARRRVQDMSARLIAQWQASKAAAAAAAAAGDADGKAAAAGGGAVHVAAAAGGGAGGAAFKEVGGGISGSSFMAAMLEGRQGARSGEERLSDTQVIAQCLTFLLAGSDTTSSTIAFTVALLASHPEAEARLTAELDEHFARSGRVPGAAAGAAAEGAEDVLPKLPYLDAVLSESMRLYPAGSILVREAPQDLDLGNGKVVPKGHAIFLANHALHHDPALWPEAESFRPERFLPDECAGLGPSHPAAYAPFGMGPRMCVGNKMATMLAKAALIEFYRRYTFRLHARQALPLRTRTAITFGPRDGVWVTVRARREA